MEPTCRPEGRSSWRQRVSRGLKHAFAVRSEDERLTAEDEAILDKAAQGVVRRGLGGPATMLLETVRPLNFLGSQGLVFFEPIVSVALDAEKYRRFCQLLEKRTAIPALLAAIERCEKRERKT